MPSDSVPVTAETMSLFQRRVERRDGVDGPWFGVPMRGFVAPGPGVPDAPFYFVAFLSGLRQLAMQAALVVQSPSGRESQLGVVTVVFDEARTAVAHGQVVGYEIDVPGDYVIRLVVNNAVVARSTFHVQFDPRVAASHESE